MSTSNPARQLAYQATYRSGPEAWTDLHAGGLFFCVLYETCLRFEKTGTVLAWNELLPGARPLHDEVERLAAPPEEGTWLVNDHGYLVCSFGDRQLTGLPWPEVPGLLAFHVHRPEGFDGSVVYRRDATPSV